jgi:hypothetical protein
MLDADLLVRIRGEFREMPGLRLTRAQARRLWHLDLHQCEALLNHPVAEGHLHQLHDGSFVAWPQPKAVPATLTSRRPRLQTKEG